MTLVVPRKPPFGSHFLVYLKGTELKEEELNQVGQGLFLLCFAQLCPSHLAALPSSVRSRYFRHRLLCSREGNIVGEQLS